MSTLTFERKVMMKKNLLVVSLIFAAVAALAFAGLAYAQDPTPAVPTDPTYGGGMTTQAWGGSQRGFGARGSMMGTAGNVGGRMMGGAYGGGMMLGGTTGPMHTYMVDAYAQALGLSVDDIQAEIDAGKSMYQIVADQGLSDEEIKGVMIQAHTLALNAMVADGLLTQEQADYRLERMNTMLSGDFTPGDCTMNGARAGRGGGRWNQQPATP